MLKIYLLIFAFLFLTFSFFTLTQVSKAQGSSYDLNLLHLDPSHAFAFGPYFQVTESAANMGIGDICCLIDVMFNNQGADTSPATIARLKIDGVIVVDKPISALTSSPVHIRWNDAWVDGSLGIGSHTWEVCIDPNNTIVETDETNNCYTETVNITGADLTTQNTTYSITKPPGLSDPINTSYVQISTQVRNIGTAVSGTNSVGLRYDINGNGTVDWGSFFSVGTLNPGQMTPLNSPAYGAPGYAGYIIDDSVIPNISKVLACADDFNGDIPETTELNNCQIGTSPAPTLDLKLDNQDSNLIVAYNSVHNLTWSTTGNPTTCTAQNAWSGNKNVAGGSESTGALTDNSYRYYLTCQKAGFPDAVDPAGDSIYAFVGPGPFTVTSNPPTGGCNVSDSFIDLAWTTSPNATSYNIFRNGVFRTNILAPQTSFRDNTTVDGTSYTYSVTAVNGVSQITGTPSPTTAVTADICPPLSVSCSASPSSVATGVPVTWTAVPAGGSGSGYTYSWSGTDSLTGSGISVVKSYSTTGTKTASVTIDDSAGNGPIGPVACSNSVTVSPPASPSPSPSPSPNQPDLIVPAAPSINTGSPVTGTVLTFKGNVQNIGTAVAGGTFNNQFTIDLDSGGTFNPADGTNVNIAQQASSQLTALAISASSQVTSGSWTAVTGTHTLRLCADQPTPAVTESNETNNCNNNGVVVDFNFTVTATPTPVVSLTSGSCLNGPVNGSEITISWTNNATPVTFVDISTVSNFASYYNKGHSGAANTAVSTFAPTGFTGFVGVSGPLTINPETTYYTRLWNGTQGATTSFNFDICPPGPFTLNPDGPGPWPTMGPCVAGVTYVDVTWTNSARVNPNGGVNPDHYEVYRNTSPTGAFTYVGNQAAAGVLTYRDNGTNAPPPACSTIYYYYVAAYNPTNPPAQTPIQPVTIPGPPDTTNPSSSLSFTAGQCYTSTTWPNPIVASAADNIGVASVSYRVRQTATSTIVKSGAATGPVSGNAQSGFWNVSIDPAAPTAFVTTPPNNQYTIEVSALDAAGNSSGWQPIPAPSFSYAVNCAIPWIQTTGGDVHTNKEINAPGGP